MCKLHKVIKHLIVTFYPFYLNLSFVIHLQRSGYLCLHVVHSSSFGCEFLESFISLLIFFEYIDCHERLVMQHASRRSLNLI